MDDKKIELSRRVMPKIIAKDIVGLSPMKAPNFSTLDEPIPRYYLLLREAQSASNRVDDFDLRSDVRTSRDYFNYLLIESHKANLALISHISENKDALLVSLSKHPQRLYTGLLKMHTKDGLAL